MRLSVDAEDPGYSPAARGATVFLDGVMVRDCVTADDERGEVIVFKHDADGKPLIDWVNQCIVKERRRGQVRIVLASGVGHA